MSDLKIFREKTVSRIIDKRREYQQRQTQEKEEERKRDTAFRRQWLEEYKQRRSKAIIDAIDHTIINNAIPDTIHHSNKLSFRHQKQNNEEELRKLTTGLDDHLTGHDQNTLIRRDSGQYTVNIQNGSSTLFEFKSGEKKKSLADCFLRNAVSQHLYIHKRAKVDLQETLLLQQQPQQQPGSLTNGIAFLPDNNSIHNNSSSNNLSVNNTNSSNGTTTAVALGRKTNDIQIAELLKDLLNANSDPLRKKVSVGLMKSLYLLSQRSGWSDIRVSGNTVTNSRNSSRVTSPRHNSDPNANNTNPSASPAKPRSDHHKPTTNIFHTSLIDGCFVVGADKRTILDIVRSKRPSSSSSMINDDSSHGSDAKRGQSSNKNKGTMEDLSKVIAQPSVLYHSDSNESAEMLELLPQYCFPSGVEVNVQEPVRMVKPPLTMPASMMFPGDVSKKDKKKSRVFFPSDYSMGGGGGGGGGSSNQTEGGNMVRSNSIDAMRPPPIRPLNPGSVPNAAPPSQPPAEKTTSFRAHTLASALNTFVLILGDHTSQRFCLGLQIPVSFTDGESGLLIDTIYTFCILTRLSFFNYLFYVILKLDEEKSILVFRELLPTYDANFPIHPDLKMIDELVSKLNKIMVPIYPFFVLKHIKASGTNDSQSPPPSSSSPMEPYFTYLPNIRLTLKLKNAEVDVIDFNRAFYQAFYTNLGITIDEGDASLIEAAIRSHEKTIVANFTPSTSHKQEREKEESFFTLQWALPTLLRHLPLDQIILALGCAVSEMNIIVKHKDMNIVSSVILSLMHLLKPLKWCSPVIVSLPDHLSDVLESPVPIMIGVQKLPANFVLMENCVVIDPLERIVHLNPNDVVKSHTILLPSASRVVHALSSHAETILVFARKQKALKFKKLTVGQSFYGRNNQLDQNMKSKSAENGNNKESEGKTMKLNIPIELQINAEDCGHYLGAIKQFSNVVQNHILAVVNTAIQIQHDENREARHKRRVVKPVKSTKTAVAPSTKDSQLNGSVGGVSADLVVTKAAATTPPNNSTTTTSELESTGNGTLSTRPTSSNMKQDGSTGQADQPLSIKPSNPPAASTSNRSQSPNGVLNREARDRSSLESGRISVGSNKSSSRTSSPTQRPPSPVPTAGQPHAKEGGLISNVTVRRKKTNTAHSGAAKRAVTLPNSPLSISSLPPPKSKDKMPISSSDPRPQSMPRDMNITHEYKTLLTNVGITTPDNTNIWGSASPSVSSKRAQPLESITVISPGQGSTASGTPSKQSPPLVERVVEKVTDKQSVPETKVPLEITVPIVGGSPNKVNEQMSDVTSTDMAMEEKSIGASPSVSASISSGASSLPSLASDAPMLALKDIGQTGLKFVKKLVETQMYSNYCQWNKSSSCMTTDQDNLHQLTMYTSPVHGGNGRCSTMVDVLTPGVSIMPSRVPSPINDHQSMEDEEETKEEFDSVVDLFVITLTGSLSEGIDKVNNQWEVYYHLYGDNPQIDWIQLSESTKDADYILKATQKVFRNSRILRKYIEKRIIANYESSSSDGSQVKFHENDFLICNGLLCHGFCNTASCTDICANIWQRKVQKLRRQQAAFNILTRKVVGGKEIGESNHHDTLLLTQQAKIEYVTSSGARLEASKHGRETESQFHLRKAVIASAMTTTTTTSSSTSRKHCRSEDDIISDDHHHHHHQPVNHHHHHHHHHRRNRKDKKRRKYDHDHDKKIRAPMYGGHPYHQARENNGDRKMRTFANTDDPYVLALAKHFAKKEVNYIRKLRRRCYARIERFLRSYITYYRRLRFHRSVIYLQAAFRGYLVRANLENLVECLLERKRARLMARIRIRNFLRYQADSIIRLLNRRMEERARKLRSQSSIPIATSTTTVTSSNINMNRAASSSVLMTKSSKVDV